MIGAFACRLRGTQRRWEPLSALEVRLDDRGDRWSCKTVRVEHSLTAIDMERYSGHDRERTDPDPPRHLFVQPPESEQYRQDRRYERNQHRLRNVHVPHQPVEKQERATRPNERKIPERKDRAGRPVERKRTSFERPARRQ